MALQNACQKFNLTKREIEITNLLAEGHTQQRMADSLNISSRTVSKHIQNRCCQ